MFTFAAERGDYPRAATALARAAVAEIDLTAHTGVHPRIGALDVLPFVPLGAATMADAVAVAHAVGREIGETLRRAGPALRGRLAPAASPEPRGDPPGRARRPARPGCASRRGHPTTGRGTLHPTAGAIAVGARGPLVAWNLVLDRPDLALARRIARTIRASNGGLPCLKALGLPLAHTGQVQVSMNLTDYRTTSMAEVFTAVEIEARRAPARRSPTSELIGLVPRAALDDFATVAPDFAARHRDAVLEDRLRACGLPGSSQPRNMNAPRYLADPMSASGRPLAGAVLAVAAGSLLSGGLCAARRLAQPMFIRSGSRSRTGLFAAGCLFAAEPGCGWDAIAANRIENVRGVPRDRRFRQCSAMWLGAMKAVRSVRRRLVTAGYIASSAAPSPPRRAGAMPNARIFRYRLLRSTSRTSAVREMLPCCSASVRRM